MNNRKASNIKPAHGLVLTRSQIADLQRTGLIAEADGWWHHPSGAFALAPIGYGTTRKRKVPRLRVTLGEGSTRG